MDREERERLATEGLRIGRWVGGGTRSIWDDGEYRAGLGGWVWD